ncbi:MAG: ABC transporter permease [Candidatus Korarchaeota archaeon]|nr:ABC transporter permease [Thermoproteota archaeon]
MATKKQVSRLKSILSELLHYKYAILGLTILIFLVILSIYAMITIPLTEAIKLWRSTDIWRRNPRNAQPEFVEIFYQKRLPRTIIISIIDANLSKVKLENNKIKATGILSFNYDYDDFPSEIIIFFNVNYSESPEVNIYWIRPDNEEIYLKSLKLRRQDDRYYLSNDFKLEDNLNELFMKKLGQRPNDVITIERGLFGTFSPNLQVLKGKYSIRFEIIMNEGDYFEAEVVVYGKVYGIAGTDHLRRPLTIALLWGAPIAISFGLVASSLITFANLIIGTISGWYKGTIDAVIQRIVEINTILPFLPILILLSTIYKIDIFVILACVIALSIFSIGTKNTRVLVMQIATYPYIEAAKAYGASNWRIIFFYIIPKILPSLIPGMISAVPGFVFLEAGLSYLGLGDPFLPTWGKVINDAFSNGALYKGYYYWVLLPTSMLVLTAISFSLIGMALEKIVNPRLKEL